MINERQIQLTVIARAGKVLNVLLRYFSPWQLSRCPRQQSPATEHDVSVPNKTNTLVNSSSLLVSTAIARTLRQAQDDTLTSVIIHGLSVRCAFPLRSLRLKHALLLITILLITNNQLLAQSPYTGGSGDGHAMGELVLRNVGVNELGNTDGYFIYPSQAKTGEAIYITSPAAGELQLIDITGRIIYTQTLQQPVQQLPVVVTQAVLCIGIIRTQAGTFTQKIIVVE